MANLSSRLHSEENAPHLRIWAMCEITTICDLKAEAITSQLGKADIPGWGFMTDNTVEQTHLHHYTITFAVFPNSGTLAIAKAITKVITKMEEAVAKAQEAHVPLTWLNEDPLPKFETM